MSVVEQSPARNHRGRRRDLRAVSAWCAAVGAAVLGVGQLFAAQSLDVLAWRGDTQPTGWGVVDEAALVVWLSAVAVGLGATAPQLLLRVVPGRRMRWALPAVAAFGALLAAPVATATAAWAQMYGGDLSQLRAVRLVCIGVVLGAATAVLAVRTRAMAWSLLGWLIIGWLLLAASSRLSPGEVPVLGHFDPGGAWSPAERLVQARLLLAVLAAATGLMIGAAAVFFGWGTAPRRRGRARTPAPMPVLAVASGPALMVAANLVAALLVGRFYTDRLVGLAVALLIAIVCGYAGWEVARRMLPGRGAIPA